MTQTVLVTGAAGFIGRAVARYFANLGFRIVGVDRAAEENAGMGGIGGYYQMTLPDAKFGLLLDSCLPDFCIHCAGRASVALSVSDPAADFYAGPTVTFELLNAIRLHARECRVIFLSSAAVYGNPESLPITESHASKPVSPYGFHKFQSELICREFAEVYQLRTASLRIFSAYGAGLRRQVLWDICQKALSPGVIKLQGNGTESRDFVHVEDIARAINQVAANGDLSGEVYNVGSGSETSIAAIAKLIFRSLKVDRVCEFDGVVPPGTPLNWRADISRLQSLGFKPAVPLDDGVAAFAAWCKAESGQLSIESGK
jgi:UDP-glucose 4-epimerase